MKTSSYLENDEEEIFKERVHLGNSDTLLVLTNFRVIFLKNFKEIINTVNYNQITKVQNSKPSDKKIDANTVSKIRIIDQKGVKIDFSFKGLESIDKSKKVASLINKKKKEAEKVILTKEENEENQLFDPFSNPEIKKDSKKIYMSENTLKSKFLEQNVAAKTMFKDLVVEEKILTEEEFWNNFKSEIAEQKTIYQKNGYTFEEEEKPTNEPKEDQSKDENISIKESKIEEKIQNLNAVKMEQETDNTAEFKPSISIPEVSEPTLPDEDDIINLQNPNENENEKEIEEEEENDRMNFIWYQEVVEPSTVDPDDFRVEAEKFSSKIETFSKEFNTLQEIALPPMKIAKSIIFEISNENYKRFNYQKTNSNPEIIIGLDTLRKHKMEQQILLVHFWQNYENLESQQNHEKALRLKNKINELMVILQNEKEAIKSKEARKALIPLYEEIEKSIIKVLNLKLV